MEFSGKMFSKTRKFGGKGYSYEGGSETKELAERHRDALKRRYGDNLLTRIVPSHRRYRGKPEMYGVYIRHGR